MRIPVTRLIGAGSPQNGGLAPQRLLLFGEVRLRTVGLAPQRLLLRGARARMYLRMGWSELSRRAPMRHVCAVVAACARVCVRRVEWRQE